MLLNYTPHALTLVHSDGTELVIPSSGVCRVSSTSEYVCDVENFPVYKTTMGKLEGLPDPEPGVSYIVSLIALNAVDPSRKDVFAPGTGPNDNCIRDEKGQIRAVTRLIGR